MSVFRDYQKTTITVDDKEYEINLRTRFFVPMVKRDTIYFPGFGVTTLGKTIDSNTKFELVECYICEDEYLVNFSNEEKDCPYKIKLVAIDQMYGSEIYYYTDFLSLIRSGHILIKENEFQKVIPYKEVATIPNSCATIVSEGTCIVDIRDYM